MKLKEKEQAYWKSYLQTLKDKPVKPFVSAGIAGNYEIANELLDLYLSGKKTAGSGLVKDYKFGEEPLPEVGDFWIILNKDLEPKCIVKTVRIETYRFSEVPEEVAIAEGEGDLSLAFWYKAHRKFFAPFLDHWGIQDLNKEEVVTEFYELV